MAACLSEDTPANAVELSEETICALMRRSIPTASSHIVVSPLPAGSSFNNKIYIIDAENVHGVRQSYVLKVNGRGFGPAKVENEVSCLRLIEHYCPDIPVPRGLAWSKDGTNVTRRTADGVSASVTPNSGLKEDIPGWILMTLCAGSPLKPDKLSSDARMDISVQLAGVLSSWRQNIPRSNSCGNLHFNPNDGSSSRSSYNPGASFNPNLYVYGLVGSGNDFCLPMHSLLEYWQTELKWQIKQLCTKLVYVSNSEALSPRLEDFVDQVLPGLPLFAANTNDKFSFTHTDFFPRNVLVQGDPPQISGIVDFEFSGFFPPMEEFVQEWLPNDDDSDWPKDTYDMILTELERLGVTTPRSLTFVQREQIKRLNALRNYIAPWWLVDADAEDDENTAVELLQAKREVEDALNELETLVNESITEAV